MTPRSTPHGHEGGARPVCDTRETVLRCGPPAPPRVAFWQCAASSKWRGLLAHGCQSVGLANGQETALETKQTAIFQAPRGRATAGHYLNSQSFGASALQFDYKHHPHRLRLMAHSSLRPLTLADYSLELLIAHTFAHRPPTMATTLSTHQP